MKTDYLLHSEVEHVLAALTYDNRLVMRVMLHTGLRIGDVLALRTAQLKPRFWVTEQKTGKRRLVGLPGERWASSARSPGRSMCLRDASATTATARGRRSGRMSSGAAGLSPAAEHRAPLGPENLRRGAAAQVRRY